MIDNRKTFDLMKYFREMIMEMNCRIMAMDIYDDDLVVIQYCEGAMIVI